MATLSTDELSRIRAELGDNLLDSSAEPLIGIRSVWEVIKTAVVSSTTAATSSSTAITAAGSTTITVASASGLTVGVRVQLDLDAQRETCSVKSVSGTTIGINARKTHGGTYPVEIESPLTIVRGILADLTALEQVTSLESWDSLGLRRVDEVEWAERGQTYFVETARRTLRTQLARTLGVPSIYAASRGGSNLEVY